MWSETMALVISHHPAVGNVTSALCLAGLHTSDDSSRSQEEAQLLNGNQVPGINTYDKNVPLPFMLTDRYFF